MNRIRTKDAFFPVHPINRQIVRPKVCYNNIFSIRSPNRRMRVRGALPHRVCSMPVMPDNHALFSQ